MRVIPQGLPLLPPAYDIESVRTVYDALLAGRRIAAQYQAQAREGSAGKYEISPFALIVRGTVIYLLGTLWEYADIRQLALHRLNQARILDKEALRPEGFDLDAYIEQGEMQFRLGPMIRLEALFERGAATHLYETALSSDQVIEDIDDDHVRIAASVPHTKQLEWWLLEFAERLTVLRRLNLRSRTSSGLTRSAANHSRVESNRAEETE